MTGSSKRGEGLVERRNTEGQDCPSICHLIKRSHTRGTCLGYSGSMQVCVQTLERGGREASRRGRVDASPLFALLVLSAFYAVYPDC